MYSSSERTEAALRPSYGSKCKQTWLGGGTNNDSILVRRLPHTIWSHAHDTLAHLEASHRRGVEQQRNDRVGALAL